MKFNDCTEKKIHIEKIPLKEIQESSEINSIYQERSPKKSKSIEKKNKNPLKLSILQDAS